MNIWIVNHYADPPDGLSTRTFDLARRMVEGGHSVTILTSLFSHYHFHNSRSIGWRPAREEVIQGVSLVWIRTLPYRRNGVARMLNMLSFAWLALLVGLFRKDRPDVVSGVTVHPLAALSAYFLARLRRAAYFIEVTDLWPESLVDLGVVRDGSARVKAMRILERFLYSRARRIVMLWRHTDRYVESLGISSERILWLPHGVEIERYVGLDEYTGGGGERFTVLYLGAFVGSMALENILEAARILQERGCMNIEFRMTGAGTCKGEIVEQADKLALKNVTFPDPVPKSQLGQAMACADAFIFGVRDRPIYRFGMSLNKLTDYLVGGRPIVYYGRSTYDPVKEAAAGFSVPPEDPIAVANAVQQLANLPAEARVRMGRNGRAWALKYHNIPVLADTLLRAMEAGIS
jgi:glycosyltransferase involved in cell wall biosynthesis